MLPGREKIKEFFVQKSEIRLTKQYVMKLVTYFVKFETDIVQIRMIIREVPRNLKGGRAQFRI